MADKEWLKNLSEATYTPAGWQLKDPNAARRLAEERFARALNDLEAEAEEAACVFNELAAGRRMIKVLSIAGKQGGGFMLLMGHCQINVQAASGALDATLIRTSGFARKGERLHRFSPHADPFGSLAWSRDNALLMGNELIIKRLFEDLTRAATGAP
jgi:hypothetical protein